MIVSRFFIKGKLRRVVNIAQTLKDKKVRESLKSACKTTGVQPRLLRDKKSEDSSSRNKRFSGLNRLVTLGGVSSMSDEGSGLNIRESLTTSTTTTTEDTEERNLESASAAVGPQAESPPFVSPAQIQLPRQEQIPTSRSMHQEVPAGSQATYAADPLPHPTLGLAESVASVGAIGGRASAQNIPLSSAPSLPIEGQSTGQPAHVPRPSLEQPATIVPNQPSESSGSSTAVQASSQIPITIGESATVTARHPTHSATQQALPSVSTPPESGGLQGSDYMAVPHLAQGLEGASRPLEMSVHEQSHPSVTEVSHASSPSVAYKGGSSPLSAQSSKRPWTKEEDDLLLQLVRSHGSKDWTSICSQIAGRNRKQCRERYKNHLEGHVKKGAWTQEEDNLIFEWQKKVGNKWSIISQQLPNRTDNAVKNRYWSATRSRERKAKKEAKKRAAVSKAQQEEDKKMRATALPVATAPATAPAPGPVSATTTATPSISHHPQAAEVTVAVGGGSTALPSHRTVVGTPSSLSAATPPHTGVAVAAPGSMAQGTTTAVAAATPSPEVLSAVKKQGLKGSEEKPSPDKSQEG